MATNNAAAAEKKKFSLKDYFRGIKFEIKKVVWPSKQELVSYTAIVVFVCAVFAIGFWAIDTACLAALRGLLGISV